jgi:transposase
MPEQFVGIDWATRRARWCAVSQTGNVIDEGWTPADEDGLATLVAHLGPDALACLEMMSGAAWVRDQLGSAGWTVQIADARKAKAVGSLAAKTDKLDARVLAELARRDLVPQVHVPTFPDRELKERLGRRMHMVRLRTAAMNRTHGVLSQFGVTLAFKRLREPDREELLIKRGIPEVWRRSIAEAVAVVAMLDQRLIPLEQELRPLARADPRVQLLHSTNPCESMISTVRAINRNVKNWTSGEMCLRWTAAGMLEAETRFRKVEGYRGLARLAVTIEHDLTNRRNKEHATTLNV